MTRAAATGAVRREREEAMFNPKQKSTAGSACVVLIVVALAAPHKGYGADRGAAIVGERARAKPTKQRLVKRLTSALKRGLPGTRAVSSAEVNAGVEAKRRRPRHHSETRRRGTRR